MVTDSIFLRTSTKQAYHCRYMNSRSKHNVHVSYVVSFQDLCILLRNQNNALGIVAELLVVSTTSRGFQQVLYFFSSALKSTPDLEPKRTAI